MVLDAPPHPTGTVHISVDAVCLLVAIRNNLNQVLMAALIPFVAIQKSSRRPA
jgi:hypothetical protein